jgi:hypothetical protein
VSTRDNGGFCQSLNETGDLTGASADYCSEDPIYSYLRVYAVVIGDFSLDDYIGTYEAFAMTLVIMLTFIGVVIMLNVLIAVISDSYEKAKVSSAGLFGRARVAFVTQNQALESFLLPKAPEDSTENIGTYSRISRWVLLMCLILTATFAQITLGAAFVNGIIHDMYIFYLIMIFCVVVILTPALLILVIFSLGIFEKFLPERLKGPIAGTERVNDFIVRFIAANLGFGETAVDEGDEDGEDEWLGRVVHIERYLETTTLEARDEMKTQLAALEKRLYEKLLNERAQDKLSELTSSRNSAFEDEDEDDNDDMSMVDE